jgi:hypothetical protein
MKILLSLAAVVTLLLGCAHRAPPPTFTPVTETTEAEYLPYSMPGSNVLTGQAFMNQKGGGVVKAAGRTVTLDPATETTGRNWWSQAGRKWSTRYTLPLSPTGRKLRRTTVADAEGRFKFEGLPSGSYYVRTEITWDVPYHGIQGGLVGKQVTVEPGVSTDVILNMAP